MNNNTFRNNIRRYILGGDEDTGMDIDMDIDKFEITKFNYRKIFDKESDSECELSRNFTQNV